MLIAKNITIESKEYKDLLKYLQLIKDDDYI